jgi:hypothetical protein
MFSARRVVAPAGGAYAVVGGSVGLRRCGGTLPDFFTDGESTRCGRPGGHFGDHFPVQLVEDAYQTGAADKISVGTPDRFDTEVIR